MLSPFLSCQLVPAVFYRSLMLVNNVCCGFVATGFSCILLEFQFQLVCLRDAVVCSQSVIMSLCIKICSVCHCCISVLREEVSEVGLKSLLLFGS